MKEVTILMPCLNEAETIGKCIERARKLLIDHNLDGEILVSDNGSTDASREIARRLGARVVDCPVRGYGAALQYGIQEAEGTYILMADSDDSYHFDEAMPMIEQLRNGFDVCMGTRLKGRIMPGAMPFLNRHLGNPVLTALGRILFTIPVSDFHCGMRAFRRDAILRLNLVTTGMEWASEMVIKSRLSGLRMTEVAVTLYKDGRNRPPHLKPWRDGWRHLRFMLLHAPTWLFILPGLFMMLIGLIGEAVISQDVVVIGNIGLDVHTMLVMSFILIIGVQTLFVGFFAKLFTQKTGILPHDERFERIISHFTLERVLIVSVLIGGAGATGVLYAVWQWYQTGFSALNYQETMRELIPSLSMVAIGIQGIFNAFMLSTLYLSTKSCN